MRVTTRIKDAIKDIEKGIVLPSIQVGNKNKYGYCKIGGNNCVSIKYLLNYTCEDVCIVSPRTGDTDINVSITNDGFIRFWTSDVKMYLKWKYDEDKDILYLKSFKRNSR